jgi:hypothetical protein
MAPKSAINDSLLQAKKPVYSGLYKVIKFLRDLLSILADLASIAGLLIMLFSLLG